MRSTALTMIAVFGALCVSRVEAHGFVLSVGGGGAGGTTGIGSGGLGSGGGTSRAPTPGSGASTMRGVREGGATKPRGGGGLPFGLGKRGDSTLRTDDAGVKPAPAGLPVEPAARGKAFKNLLRDDAKGAPDFSYVLEASTVDARMRSVELRVSVFERRVAFGDVRRRFEVSAKDG
ncbi:MAG TPA: hypothetical protein VEI02_01515, partial [Planctomycetota bacterium]|nr:hypothetical protein [Planctomycetota bacterium]